MGIVIMVIVWMVLGASAGWVATLLTGAYISLPTSMALGIAGAVAGGMLAGALGIGSALVNFLLAIVAGGSLVLFVQLLRRGLLSPGIRRRGLRMP